MAAESKLEKKCREYIEDLGGRMPKWTSPGNVGVPDRIVLLAGLPPIFVELKAPGKMLDPAQERWSRWLHRRGFDCWRIDNFTVFKGLINALLQ